MRRYGVWKLPAGFKKADGNTNGTTWVDLLNISGRQGVLYTLQGADYDDIAQNESVRITIDGVQLADINADFPFVGAFVHLFLPVLLTDYEHCLMRVEFEKSLRIQFKRSAPGLIGFFMTCYYGSA